MLFDEHQIRSFSSRAKTELVEALVNNQDQFEVAGINTPLRIAHFFAQIATETGGLRRISESLNYSEKRLRQVFSSRLVSEEDAARLTSIEPVEDKVRAIANWVYGARLGNLGRDTDDGWNYRGSGFIQLTGRDNFRRRGDEIQLPLEDVPEIARQPFEGLLAAIAYWTARNINEIADDDDIGGVREAVNGGARRGLADSKIWYRRARRAFDLPAAPEFESFGLSESELNAAIILNRLGCISDDEFKDGGTPTRSVLTNGITDFQTEEGLRAIGVMDDDTFYALVDQPVSWHPGEEEGATRE